MTIRPQTLARQGTDLLLDRLRDVDPACSITRAELIRRGEAAAMFNAVRVGREQRFLERLPSPRLAAEAHRMDLELEAGIA